MFLSQCSSRQRCIILLVPALPAVNLRWGILSCVPVRVVTVPRLDFDLVGSAAAAAAIAGALGRTKVHG
jgi:hypothetical protein